MDKVFEDMKKELEKIKKEVDLYEEKIIELRVRKMAIISKRNDLIVELRGMGISTNEISQKVGLGLERVEMICRREEIEEKRKELYGDLYELPNGLQNCLIRANINSRQQLINALKGDGQRIRGVGKTYISILEPFVGFKITKDGLGIIKEKTK